MQWEPHFQVGEWQPCCYGVNAGLKKMAKEFMAIPKMKLLKYISKTEENN